MMTLIVR